MMTAYRFEMKPEQSGPHIILRVPKAVSETLPSRGMVMVTCEVNGIRFAAPLEPDGRGGHWLLLSEQMAAEARITAGTLAGFSFTPLRDWPEPPIPQAFWDALHQADLVSRWDGITVKARWEWVRWIRAAQQAVTREKRIETACSKLSAGMNRPCCFDQSRCTLPEFCRNGILPEDPDGQP